MGDVSIVEANAVITEPRPQDAYFKFVSDAHTNFINEHWKNPDGTPRPFFHGPRHFKKAGEILHNIANAAVRKVDPLAIVDALQKEGYTINELRKIAPLFGVLHDLGNFMDSVSIDENDNLQPVYLDKFREENAVPRTLQMVDAVCKKFGGYSENEINLLKRLIHATLYDPKKREYAPGNEFDSLAAIAKVSDLLYTLFEVDTREIALGLTEEKISEGTLTQDERADFMTGFYQFPIEQFFNLVGNDNAGELIPIITATPESNIFKTHQKSS